MRIALELPDRVWGRLATAADAKGVKVADLIGDAVATIVEPKRRGRPKVVTPEVEERIRELHALHRSGTVIAAEVGVSASTVYEVMKRMGLPTLIGSGKAARRERKNA